MGYKKKQIKYTPVIKPRKYILKMVSGFYYAFKSPHLPIKTVVLKSKTHKQTAQ